MPLKLIIFDCDGVLIDSEIIACRITAEELTRHGFLFTQEEIADRFLGIPSAPMYATIEKEYGRTVPDDLRSRVRSRIRQLVADELEAVPGVHETLDRISHNVCVASSSGLDYLKIALSRVLLYDRLSPHIFSAQQVARGKPAPDLFLYAAREMGVANEDCLVIEDSIAGVTAGLAAGMRVFGFAGGSHCPRGHGDRLCAHGAERTIDVMTDLPGIIDELN